jgi:hypothetical protein
VASRVNDEISPSPSHPPSENEDTFDFRQRAPSFRADSPQAWFRNIKSTFAANHCKNTSPKIRKQTFPEKEMSGLNPNFQIHVSVSDLYIPTISLPILQQENMWTDPENVLYNSLKTNECGNWD